MIRTLEAFLQEHRREAYGLFSRCLDVGRSVMLRPQILHEFDAFCAEQGIPNNCGDNFREMIHSIQEAAASPPDLYMAIRSRVAGWQYVHVQVDSAQCREVGVTDFLAFKEALADPGAAVDPYTLEIDLSPFERGFPKLREVRSIGRGVEFLNRHLSSRLFDRRGDGREQLFGFLKLHQHQGRQLMLNDLIADRAELADNLREALAWLEQQDPEADWSTVGTTLKRLGFEPGWGRTVRLMIEEMVLLSDILEAPAPESLERFLGRIPMIFSLVILTPHGYFGQSGVLGKPDTGGQVVYILDQVRALENEMRQSIHDQGLEIEPKILVVTRLLPEAEGTSCDRAEEPVCGTRHTKILRVPFRNENGEVVQPWISRFRVWPYLERFTDDVERVVLAELGGRPDLVIGNYSDGNLVATLLSRRLGVTQCTIAHALEKSKYLHSDLYWKEHEEAHHFSCQYTADLIAMNTSDFIITSTYQEIAGTREVVGQYEGYSSFSMPGLFRVVSGIDPFDPKFNIVSPGADPEVFFPYTESDRRVTALQPEIADLVHGGERPDARGVFVDKQKPLLFTMARLDKIKNVTGLVDLFGRSAALRDEANLMVAGGFLDTAQSQDEDEKKQIETMHRLLDEHGLDGQARWIPMRTEKTQVGELYRYVADWRGAFVQPALFEAFGLTVVEAMASGLPTFATQHGGPLEIIEHGRSGFHIDPAEPGAAAELMAGFLAECREDPERWESISRGAIDRIESRYTWKLYANRLLTLSRIYGFWKYITNIEREETRRYLEMFYALVYRRLAAEVPRD